MKVWQLGLGVLVLGVGGAAVFWLSRKQAQTSGGAPAPNVSVTDAAVKGTGSSGEPSETNKYDAIVGVATAIGTVASDAISSGALADWFKDDGDSSTAIRSSDNAGVAAPGQTILFN